MSLLTPLFRLEEIQTARQLFDLGSGAVEYSTSSLRYDGRLEKQMISQQTVTGNNSIEKTCSYDHADRVLVVKNAGIKEGSVKMVTWVPATR